MLRGRNCRRRGATAVEAAVVLPVTFFLLFGVIEGSLLVYKSHEVTHIARETARFASIHGSKYANYNSAIIPGTLPTVDYDYLKTYAKGLALTIPSSDLTVTVQIQKLPSGTTTNSGATLVDWSTGAPTTSTFTDATGNSIIVCNMVVVTITTTWTPNIFALPGSYTITSTSTHPMQF